MITEQQILDVVKKYSKLIANTEIIATRWAAYSIIGCLFNRIINN